MTKKWTKQHLYLLAGIVFAVALIYFLAYFYMIKPITVELQATAQQSTMFEKQLSKLSIPSEQDDVISTINEQIPPHKSLDVILARLNKIASETNVSITFIESSPLENVQGEDDSSIIQSYDYLLELTSNELKHIQAFLKGIESGNPLMVINQLSTSHSSSEVMASILITTYVQTN